MKTTAQVLAEVFDYSRQISLDYFNKVKDRDIFQEFTVNGTKLNSAYWLLGHLVVTENYLLLKSTGGEIVRFGWARPFGLGGSLEAVTERISVEEIFATMHEVHTKAMQHVKSLSDEQLKLPNTGAIKFGDGSIYDIIRHAIEHEGAHGGHLGWVNKLLGVKNT